jgi:hypothetical protein
LFLSFGWKAIVYFTKLATRDRFAKSVVLHQRIGFSLLFSGNTKLDLLHLNSAITVLIVTADLRSTDQGTGEAIGTNFV